VAVIYPPQTDQPTLVTWGSSRDAVELANKNFGSYPSEMSLTAWAAALDRHVTGFTPEDSWETTVGIDRGSEKLAASGLDGDLITAAETSCAIYNSMPQARAQGFVQAAALRNGGPGDGTGRPPPPIPQPTPPGSAPPALPGSASLSYYWWGAQLYVDHAAVQEITSLEGAAAAIAAYLAAKLPGIGSVICGALAVSLAVQSIWLTWADNHCNQQGAYLKEYWIALGAPFIATVC
jgi:hypothetical protein